jgi:hypothetical protein
MFDQTSRVQLKITVANEIAQACVEIESTLTPLEVVAFKLELSNLIERLKYDLTKKHTR